MPCHPWVYCERQSTTFHLRTMMALQRIFSQRTNTFFVAALCANVFVAHIDFTEYFLMFDRPVDSSPPPVKLGMRNSHMTQSHLERTALPPTQRTQSLESLIGTLERKKMPSLIRQSRHLMLASSRCEVNSLCKRNVRVLCSAAVT